jgi:hypothetical protein
VKSRWNDDEAAARADDLDLCVYASRLLGADTTLVLSGGGNSSVKTVEDDVFGEPVDVLHVKGSGWDMASIQPAGFAPLRLDRVARLAELPALSDGRMADELAAASLDAAAPAPSVESILHAILPFRFVFHTHADALLALTNTPAGRSLVDEVYGDEVVVVPYVMPGFALARLCAERFPADSHAGTPRTRTTSIWWAARWRVSRRRVWARPRRRPLRPSWGPAWWPPIRPPSTRRPATRRSTRATTRRSAPVPRSTRLRTWSCPASWARSPCSVATSPRRPGTR